MSEERRDDQDEPARRTVHLILDFISVSEGIQHTDELPAAFRADFVRDLLDLEAIRIRIEEERDVLDPSVLILAMTFVIETLLLTVLDRSGDEDRLALINSIREMADEAYGVG